MKTLMRWCALGLVMVLGSTALAEDPSAKVYGASQSAGELTERSVLTLELVKQLQAAEHVENKDIDGDTAIVSLGATHKAIEDAAATTAHSLEISFDRKALDVEELQTVDDLASWLYEAQLPEEDE